MECLNLNQMVLFILIRKTVLYRSTSLSNNIITAMDNSAQENGLNLPNANSKSNYKYGIVILTYMFITMHKIQRMMLHINPDDNGINHIEVTDNTDDVFGIKQRNGFCHNFNK